MRWRSILVYLLIFPPGIVLGIVGALAAAVLLALLVGIALGAGERGGGIAFWLILPAWAGFSFFFLLSFFWQRQLGRLLVRILLTLALEAFAFPLAGLSFLAGHFERSVLLAGDQTVVFANVVGVMLGGLGVIGAAVLVALVIGGLIFLLVLLLQFNLTYARPAPSLYASRWPGRMVRPPPSLEARRRMGRTVAVLILIGVLVGLFAVEMAPRLPAPTLASEIAAREGLLVAGLAPGQPTPAVPPYPSPEPLPGIIVAGPMEDMMPMMVIFARANRFIKHTELAALGVLFRMDRFKKRFLAELGLGPPRPDLTLQAARQLLESYVFSTGNPNLRVGEVRDVGEEVEGEIVTHSQELVERLRIDKYTGALRAVR